MPLLHKDLTVHHDIWTYYGDDQALPDIRTLAIVSASRFVALHAQQERLPTGVSLSPADTTSSISAFVGALKLICIDFPVYTDGRGYSHARLLRERYGYAGELRATGDVRADQISFMQRSGINAFDCKVLPDIAHLKQLITRFEHNYQPSYPLPKLG